MSAPTAIVGPITLDGVARCECGTVLRWDPIRSAYLGHVCPRRWNRLALVSPKAFAGSRE